MQFVQWGRKEQRVGAALHTGGGGGGGEGGGGGGEDRSGGGGKGSRGGGGAGAAGRHATAPDGASEACVVPSRHTAWGEALAHQVSHISAGASVLRSMGVTLGLPAGRRRG